MRLFYTLLTVIAVCTLGQAQSVIGQENAPTVGDSWSLFFLSVPSAQFPVPEVGTFMAYDFTAVGDLIDEDFEIPIKDVPLDSLSRIDILAIPTGTDEPAFDSLPETAVRSSFVFPELDDDGNEFALSDVLDVTEEGVFLLAESDFDFSTGEIEILIERLEAPEQIFTFGQMLGDTARSTEITVEDNIEFGTQDSTYYTETRVYAGFGSLKTWFAEYEEVVVYKTFSEFRYYNRDLGTDDPFTIASVQLSVTYDFIRPGSFAPVVCYSYDTFDRDGLTPPDNVNFRVAVPTNLTDITNVNTDRFRLSVSPNPANERVTVAFEHAVAGPANLSLFNAAGQEVLHRDLGELPAGNHQLPLEFSTKLPAGTYFLRLSDGVATSAAPLIIK
ncbi:T9SS type A sorting domain-containing protein [Neolewinella persica]|uniref:T9SS type A sorting domain-containing protein n=1 Tax=Neolewinella persica TaxID=70998 RepID=UPI00036ACC89|nr:T9SS type A sorting domain-containing protein [Neolewinella persica]